VDCGRAHDRARRPSGGRRYPRSWQLASKAHIAAVPICMTCGTLGAPDNPLTGGHVVPRVLGGTERDGIITQCRRCNSAQGAR
jgi:5-methylcytosine-specific restriction endonuclease McrA